jgi:hypothetical protein
MILWVPKDFVACNDKKKYNNNNCGLCIS